MPSGGAAEEDENVKPSSSLRKPETKKGGKDAKDPPPPDWVIYSAGSYAVVMLIIGLPLWWKTTAVQRVPLPYHDMLTSKNFLDEQLKIRVNIQFNGFTSEIENPNDLLKLEGYTFHHTFGNSSSEDIETIYKTEDIYGIDAKFCEKYNQKDILRVFYVGRADFLKEYGHQIILGNCRTAYYVSNSSKMSRALVSKLLKRLLVPEIAETLDGEKLQLPLSLGYDILLSLLVPEPEIRNFEWSMETARSVYLKRIFEKMADWADLNVRSQYLYYVQLNVNPRFSKDKKLYEVPYHQLPLVINPVESKLSSFVSQNSTLNFLVYTSPCYQNPMQLLDPEGLSIKSNSFVVPQWGGIQIYNGACNEPRSANSTENQLEHINLKQVMPVIASQFRELVGISNDKSKGVLELRMSAFRDWEIDLIIRQRLHKLLYTSANTLQSLGQLLDQITNIVVTEEVGSEVRQSTEALKAATQAASQGTLVEALKQAKIAYHSSEVAFHHPTNLAQLYFPDDQKYAIYIPLFLPIGIPVLFSLQNIVKNLLRMYKERVQRLVKKQN